MRHQNAWLRWSVVCPRSKDDFKHLCRKITHTIMEKEQKHNAASLSFDDQTKRKIAKFIKEFFVRNPIHAMVSFERGDGCGADGACVRRASCPTTRTHGGASEPSWAMV